MSQDSGICIDRWRDPALREAYALAAVRMIPRLLAAVDRNPYRVTYGCFDREFWHYRTAAFPSGMHQEGVWPLALAYAREFPSNRWRGNGRLKDLAVAGLRFAANSSHNDASCDDYYPFERAYGAAAFSLLAAVKTCELLEVDTRECNGWLWRRAEWLANHSESGRLANHHALVACALVRLANTSGGNQFQEWGEAALERVLDWQHDEGWFEEYGGADPGYQTVTIDCLADLWQRSGNARLERILSRAIAFAGLFLHPDGSYGGEYGSRGTYHFYPRGFELLASRNGMAAVLADAFLQSLAAGTQAPFDDDRMYVHRLGNFIEAYCDWSPTAPPLTPAIESFDWLPGAGLLIRREPPDVATIVSTARGGVFKHFGGGAGPTTDAGLVLETTRGRVAVSQMHVSEGAVAIVAGGAATLAKSASLTVERRLHWASFETATPLKQAVLHLGMLAIGRWCRTFVRKFLQRRTITGRREAPIRWRRQLDFLPANSDDSSRPTLRVRDEIQLIDPRLQVSRMSFATDLQAAYVAAADQHHDSSIACWTDLADHVGTLNRERCVTITREL